MNYKKRQIVRTRWERSDIYLLRAVYALNKYPTNEDLTSLAVICNKDVRQFKIWFQNARQRNLRLDIEDIDNAKYMFLSVNDDD